MKIKFQNINGQWTIIKTNDSIQNLHSTAVKTSTILMGI